MADRIADTKKRKETVDSILRESLRVSLELQRELGKIQKIVEDSITGGENNA